MKKIFEDYRYAIGWTAIGFLVVVVFLSIYLVSTTVGVVKKYDNDVTYNSISVTGQSEILAKPDIASFNYTITEVAKTAEDAQKTATEKYTKTVEYLKAQGIEDKDIKTTGFNISPRYEWLEKLCTASYCPPSGRQTITGYEVRNSTEIKVRQMDKAGDLITGITNLGVNDVSNLSFVFEDDSILKDEARQQAIKDAKMRAGVIAETLGIKLGDVISFSEDVSGDEPMPYYSKGYGGAEMAVAQDSLDLNPGENKISATVYVTYEIK